jgi:hypothetical protein
MAELDVPEGVQGFQLLDDSDHCAVVGGVPTPPVSDGGHLLKSELDSARRVATSFGWLDANEQILVSNRERREFEEKPENLGHPALLEAEGVYHKIAIWKSEISPP